MQEVLRIRVIVEEIDDPGRRAAGEAASGSSRRSSSRTGLPLRNSGLSPERSNFETLLDQPCSIS
jgi:hypothetical protein